MNNPDKLPPIKITITPDDFKDISTALKGLPEETRKRLSEAIRDQDINNMPAADLEFISIIAYFAKITNQIRDRKLIKQALYLDDQDLAYLIETATAPDGVINWITNYTITGDDNSDKKADPEPIKESQHFNNSLADLAGSDDLFPDLKPDPPTLTVDYDERIIHADKASISISKASQIITKIINRETTPIRVSSTNAKKQTEIKLTLSLNIPENIQTSRPITFYDRIIEDAIGNLFDQGFSKITPEMVYRQINGMNKAKQVSKTAAEKIDRCIKRLARTWISIDFTEQLQQLTKDRLQKGEIQGNIINANNILLKFADGTVKSGWHIKEAPKVYNYSKIIRQIATVPTILLDTTQAARSTEEVTAAKYYLIAQIERIRRNPVNQKILFNSLFEAIGDTTAQENRVIKKRRIDAITAILEHFKVQRYITDYTITKERGGKIDGVIIEVPAKQAIIEE